MYKQTFRLIGILIGIFVTLTVVFSTFDLTPVAAQGSDDLVLIQDLFVSSANVQVNEYVLASYRVKNVGGAAITLDFLGVQGRLNGDLDGTAADFHWIENLTLQPGEEYYYETGRTFDTAGSWRLRPNYKPQGGDWSDVHRADGTINEVWITVEDASGPFTSCADITEIPHTECEALVALYNGTNGSNWSNKSGWLTTNKPCGWYGVTCDGSHITMLSLFGNQLSGSIPPELGDLTNLTHLLLGYELDGGGGGNQLSGVIPPELGSLTNLQSLYISNNQLSGVIPPELGNLANLRGLDLSYNQLSGSIPSDLGNLTNLYDLLLHSNQLSGSIPSSLGNLTNLYSLTLDGNLLSGNIPPNLGNLSNLQYINLGDNELTGNIPSSLGNLTNLQVLRLYYNQLSGSIPPELGNLVNLQNLEIQSNQLSGNIPSALGDLTNLQTLELHHTQLSGALPGALTKLSLLERFVFYDTNLCVPPDSGFQNWLSGVNYVDGTGITCATPPSKPPLVLVHGIQTFSFGGGYDCSQGIQQYTSSPNNSTLGDIAGWLNEDYDVWIAHLTSGPSKTPSIQQNANCLKGQINEVYNNTGKQKVVVVAHSMGGLVSRACLSMSDCRSKVKSLYTLGTPHDGISGRRPVTAFDALIQGQWATFQMNNKDIMKYFNNSNRNQPGILYTFIGGSADPSGVGWLLMPFEGHNDGVVGRYSAIGWSGQNTFTPPNWPDASLPIQYWTDEVHSAHAALPGYAYYETRPNAGNRSQSYACFAYREKLAGYTSKPSFCNEAIFSNSLMAASNPPLLSEATANIEGHLTSNETVTHTIQVDTSEHSLFNLSWITGTLSFSLTQPGGQVIDPTYAAANPGLVIYNTSNGSPELPPLSNYVFTNTLPGLWTLNISAEDVGPGGTDYQAFVGMESSRILSVTMSNGLYNIGDTAIITATLRNDSGGIGGATVEAVLHRPDNVTDTLTFTEQGGGIYKTNYTVPNTSGYIVTSVKAQGNDGGTSFTRQDDTLITVASAAAQLSGQYADYPQDADGNHLYEELIFEVKVTATQVGTYTISANLAKGSTLIANTTVYTLLPTGTQTVTLRFNGDDIQNSGLDGPYMVSNLIVNDLQNGAVPAILATDVWTTAAYQYSQFGSGNQTYLPIIIKN